MVYIRICSPCVINVFLLGLPSGCTLGHALWNALTLRLQMPCTYPFTCNHATTISQQSTTDTQQSTNPPAAPPPTQPVVYAEVKHSTNPPAAPGPVVSTETKTTGQVSAMFKCVLSNDVSISINNLCHVLSVWCYKP